MDSRRRFHGGRLFAGTTERGRGSRPPVFTGAGSRREDNEGKSCEIPGLRCAALGMTCGPGRMSDGFSSPREQRREGWVPASARTTRGRGRVPVPVCTGGRLCAGTTEGGMGPRIREDNGGEGQQDSWASLRCARNDMWVVGRGSRRRVWGSGSAREQRSGALE